MFDSLNHSLFLLINAHPDTPAWAIQLGVLLAKHVIYVLPVLLTAMWLWGDAEHRNTALKSLVLTGIALTCNQLIGIGFHMQRPFELGLGHTFLMHAATAAFPSNHLTIFLCVGLCGLLGATPRIGATVVILGVAVGWARVFVGVHFPLDMIGAALVTVVVYAVFTPLWDRHGPALTMRFQRLYRRVLALPISAGWVRY